MPESRVCVFFFLRSEDIVLRVGSEIITYYAELWLWVFEEYMLLVNVIYFSNWWWVNIEHKFLVFVFFIGKTLSEEVISHPIYDTDKCFKHIPLLHSLQNAVYFSVNKVWLWLQCYETIFLSKSRTISVRHIAKCP